MKKILVVLFVLSIAIMAMGCGAEKIYNVKGKVVVKIERAAAISSDPYLAFSAESVLFNYDQRRIEISGISSITGDLDFQTGMNWVVPELEVVDSKIVIFIPRDAEYHIYIGKQYHLLPKIIEEKK